MTLTTKELLIFGAIMLIELAVLIAIVVAIYKSVRRLRRWALAAAENKWTDDDWRQATPYLGWLSLLCAVGAFVCAFAAIHATLRFGVAGGLLSWSGLIIDLLGIGFIVAMIIADALAKQARLRSTRHSQS